MYCDFLAIRVQAFENNFLRPQIEIFFAEFCSVFIILNKHTTYFLEYPECEVNNLVGSDKSGSYTKSHFEIVARRILSSAFNVHIFSKFECLDSPQNMLNVLERFENQIKNMQQKIYFARGIQC